MDEAKKQDTRFLSDERSKVGETQSPLVKALSRQDEAINGLDIAVDMLESRLRPISNSHRETEATERPDANERKPESDVVSGINDMTMRIVRAAHSVRRITEQLDV